VIDLVNKTMNYVHVVWLVLHLHMKIFDELTGRPSDLTTHTLDVTTEEINPSIFLQQLEA
jgi:hypothetical protein